MKRLVGMLFALGFFALGTTNTGCAAAYYDPYYYDYTYYDPYYYSYDAAYAYGWYDPYGYYYLAGDPQRSTSRSQGSMSQAQTATIDLNAAAAAIASRAPTYYMPAGCAVATASGATVTYVFSECTGPFGNRPTSGNVVLNLSENNGQLIFKALATDLKVDGRSFILDLTATATTSNGQRTVTIDSHSRSPDQVESRTSHGTLTWQQGSNCVEMSAQSNSTRGALTVNSTIDKLQRCGAQCPTSGKVTVDAQGATFNSTFDGSNTMTVTSPSGVQRTFDLQCQM